MMEKAILWKSFMIYGCFFVFAALLALVVQSLRPKSDDRMNIWIRIASWLCIVPLFIFSAYFGKLSFTVLVGLLTYFGLKEYVRVVKIKPNCAFCRTAFGLSLLSLLCALFGLNEIFFSLPVLAVLTTLLVPVFTQKFQNGVYLSAGTLLGTLYVGWMFGFLILVRNLAGGFGYIVFLGTMAAAEDNIAYAFGKIFGRGKKKLIPEISPNKTVIGSVGGVLGTVLVAWLFRFAVPDLSLSQCLALGLLLGITGQLGDLVKSAIKRDMGVKDMGTLIPGHGGVLDRFDSWIFSAPFVYYYLKFLIR
jgi:phosphatidate cytidylyltransferase